MPSRSPAKRPLHVRRDDGISDVERAKQIAADAGCKFYIGSPCTIDPSHGNVRYTESGACVECNKTRAKRSTAMRREAKATKVTARQADMLKRDPDAFTFVAFTLGSVKAIRKWVESISRKTGTPA